MEIIKNNKGGSKLCFEGYTYTKKSASKTTIHWECSQRKAYVCKGKVTTDSQVARVIRTIAHSHDANLERVKATKIIASMKESAGTGRAKPAQLFADHTRDATTDVRAEIGNQDVVKRTIRREKAKHLPKSPVSLFDLEVTGEWTTTGGVEPEDFLIHDSGPESDSRIFVFASQSALTHLASADKWYMDGTFDVAPLLFQQLYVIRAPLGESAVSCVYAFLPNKLQSTYEEFLTAVTSKCSDLGFQPDPTTVVTDFERAAINAVSTVLGPHVRSQGCFYHLTQSTWRKIQSLGLVTLYRDSEEVKLFCGMLDGLAFLPVGDVPAGLAELKEDIPEGLEPLVDYFNATYISGTYRNVQRPPRPDGTVPPILVRKLPPLFPPDLWNVNIQTMAGGSRTNNLCEAWNRGFRSLVGTSHPTIWKAIEHIRLDHHNVKTAILLEARGQPPQKRIRKATKQLQDKLFNLCQAYYNDQKTLLQTLKGIGYCIRWK